MSEIRFVPAWRRDDPNIRDDAFALWDRLKVLPAGVTPEVRAREICAAAYEGDRLIGLSSAAIVLYPPLRQNFAFTRVLVDPEQRRRTLARQFILQSRDILQAWAKVHPEAALAGLAAIITVPRMLDKPVAESGLALVGYTPEGYEVRVIWFDHFRVPR